MVFVISKDVTSLKDIVSNCRGWNFTESGGYSPWANPFAEGPAKTLLSSIPENGYLDNSEGSATRVMFNMVNYLDHYEDASGGVDVRSRPTQHSRR